MSDFVQVDGYLKNMLSAVSAAERLKLSRILSNKLRRSQQERIRTQVEPDGTPFTPRKPRREKKGRIRKGMFAKLRTNKHLRIYPSSEGLEISFPGPAGRIAEIHHYGLREKFGLTGPTVQMPQRRLLGFTEQDDNVVADETLNHLTKSLL